MRYHMSKIATGIVLGLSLIASGAPDAQAATKKATPKKTATTKKSSGSKASAKPAAIPAPTACTNFYQYTNQQWFKDNPLGTGVSSYSALNLLRLNAESQQAALLNSFMTAPQNNVQKILGDFWASGLDEASIEADGANPIAPLLSRVNGIRNARDVAPSVAALHQIGLPVLFNFSADLDLKDLNRSIGYFTQGGIGLPDPAIYTNRSPEITKLMQEYRAYVSRMLLLSGTTQANVSKELGWVMAIESDMAALSKANADLDILQSQYATVTTKGLNRRYPLLQLEDFLKVQGVKDDVVSIADEQYFAGINGLVGKYSAEQWRSYLRWRIADSMAPYLSKTWRDASFDFRGRILQGRSSAGTRAQQALAAVNAAAGPMLGREYAARFMSAQSRSNAERIAATVRTAMADAIERDTGLSAEAKAEALAKVRKTSIEVGYPKRDLDYTIQPMGRGSFGSNILIASTWQHAQEMKRIGKGNSDRRWDVLPQTPSVAYEPEHNRLIITAAALQSPIYSETAMPARWYGSLGAMIGHELSRGSDLDGRMINSAGRIGNWWSQQDLDRYESTARSLAAQYQGKPYMANTAARVNGSQVLNVAMADQTGVQLARDAFVKAYPGADMKPFFEGWAGVWAQQLSSAVALADARESAFAPGEWRTNIPLSNLPEFAATYSCPATAPMVVAPASQVRVWR